MRRGVLLLLLCSLVVRCALGEVEDQVVFLPTSEWNHANATVPLTFTAFGKKVDLLLSKNENLLSPNFQVWKRESGNGAARRLENHLSTGESLVCHYIYEDAVTSAAVSLCNAGSVHGFVFLENDSLEISPLDSSVSRRHGIEARSSSFGEPHLVRRRLILSARERRAFGKRNVIDDDNEIGKPRDDEKPKEVKKSQEYLTIELALFLDASAYRHFRLQLSGDESRLLDLLLAYVNNIQALYFHPSLGTRIAIVLVRLELMERQPDALASMDGERGKLLDAFCAYSKSLNPPEDDDPGHWDIGLYVSGLDFYAVEADGKSNPVTMGLAPVGGACWDEFACVIAEFGVSNRLGKPYPSAGFTSVYIAAHEIAHNLGMHHDSVNNDCPKDGYIMSPSRGVHGETQWSPCSRDKASELARSKPCLRDRPAEYSSEDKEKKEVRELRRKLDHRKRYGELPGRHWTAKRQCEILLNDPEAYPKNGLGETVCLELKCKSPRRTGFYSAGPALDGTKCDDGKECKAGDCLLIDDRWEPLPALTTPEPSVSGWSDWREGKCESGCIRGSLGYLERRRTCLGETTCPGLGLDVRLCKDHKLCDLSPERKRLSVEEYAGLRCREFARHLPEIDANAPGLQADHEVARAWIACAVFCKRKDIGSYYAPRLELNDLGLEPYLPDGTWCHRDEAKGENYFCRNHHCLPESFRFGKGLQQPQQQHTSRSDKEEDQGKEEEEEKEEKDGEEKEEEEEMLGPMNAVPLDWRPPPDLVRYFSLDAMGKPLLTRLADPSSLRPPGDDDFWLDPEDYVELPDLALMRRAKTQRPFFM